MIAFAEFTKPAVRCAGLWLSLLLAASAFADNSKISPEL